MDRRSGISARAAVLQGLGLAILCSAATEALILRASDGNAGMAMTWLTGTLNGIGWPQVGQALWLLPLALPLLLSGRTLDRLELLDDLSRALGVRVPQARFGLAALAALLTGGVVALIGAPILLIVLAAEFRRNRY